MTNHTYRVIGYGTAYQPCKIYNAIEFLETQAELANVPNFPTKFA